MNDILMARVLFGTTMGFHVIFATLGVGIPLMILAAELFFHKTKDQEYQIMAKRWTKAFAVLLGVGIPSGTIAGVQLSLLWPGFMEVVGKVIALPFQIEIFAFFLESLFMSIYVYAADRLSPFMRIVSLSLVAVGAAASAILITNVHAFEGTPAGFRMESGKVVDVDPWAAFFNPGFLVTAEHVVYSAFMTGAFVIASVSAVKLLKKKLTGQEQSLHRKALALSLVIGGIFSIMTAFNGHTSAQELHKYQPEKLAAAEGLFKTQPNAPLTIGGYTDPVSQTVKYGIEIPGLLSFLAANRFDEVVTGLNDFPKNEWPPLFIHTLFNSMVGIGILLIVLSLIGFIWNFVTRKRSFPRWLLWMFVASGPLSLLSIEFGWIFSCTGRQPWVIYRVMTTAESATKTGNIGMLFVLFAGAYLFLAIVTVLVLRYYFKRHPLHLEYGPDTIDLS